MTKTQVEDCRRLRLSGFRGHLYPGATGIVRWFSWEREAGSLTYYVIGADAPIEVRLLYRVTWPGGEQREWDYRIQLTSSRMPRGGTRYWFLCPLPGCGRRASVLYLPTTRRPFGCRYCFDLTYESRQTRNTLRRYYRKFYSAHPGPFPEDPSSAPDLLPDAHSAYISVEELLGSSGLRPDDLAQLSAARLLLPDTKDGRYRPKLVSWARKLAYLLREGWEIDEIRRWAAERWQSGNPRAWPPSRLGFRS